MNEVTKGARFLNASFIIFFITVLLMPILIMPVWGIPHETAKGMILFLGVLGSFACWLSASLAEGSIKLPKSRLLFFASLIPLALIIAGFFSKAPGKSFFGTWYETGTVAFGVISFLILLLASIFSTNRRKVFSLYTGLFGVYLIISFTVLISIILLILRLPIQRFWNSVGTFVGSWSDFALFSGFFLTIFLLTIELLPLSRMFKILVYTALFVSLFFLAAINFLPVWIFVGIASFLVFVASLTFWKDEEGGSPKKFPAVPFSVILISLFFILTHNSYGGYLASRLGLADISIRPSAQTTLAIEKSVLKESPVWGVGPNRFSSAWYKYKPSAINFTNFADTRFNTAFGFLPTYAITAGLLGLVSVLLYLVFFFREGIRQLSKKAPADPLTNYLLISSFVGATFVYLSAIFFVPGPVLLIMGSVMAGIFIGLLVYKKDIRLLSIDFLTDPRKSFFSIVALLFLIVLSITGIYLSIERSSGIIAFQRSLAAPNFEKVEARMVKAANMESSDLYYRMLSNIYIAQINVLLSGKDTNSDRVKNDVSVYLQSAERSAQLAIQKDPTEVENWTTLGEVYTAGTTLGVQNAYDNAVKTYDQARIIYPNSPSIDLLSARLELAKRNESKAREYIDKAIAKKPNYADAYLLLADMGAAKNDSTEVEKNLLNAVSVAPNNASVLMRYGAYQFNNKNWVEAIAAFRRITALYPLNQEGRYFLALAYAYDGDREAAERELDILTRLYPANKDHTERIKDNMRVGADPLEGIK